MEDNYKHRGMRRSLVNTLKQKGIQDKKVLRAINDVPRHFFFENAFLEHAYQDKAFPIGEGQTISQPYTVAYQTELLEVEKGDKVLEIGTGSGYQACILLSMGAEVYTIEYNRVLFEKTKKFLPAIGFKPHFRFGDGSKGWPSQAPFDKILVTAGAPEVPRTLVDQLKTGGILVIPVGSDQHQRMYQAIKISEDNIKINKYDYFSFVPLLGDEGWKKR